MNQAVQGFLQARAAEFDQIPGERRATLEKISAFVRERLASEAPARLVWICTHNSRRSHFAQAAAFFGAHLYGLKGVESYSGGTEATALASGARQALQEAGFPLEELAAEDAAPSGPSGHPNPRYRLRLDASTEEAAQAASIELFSKRFSDASNPAKDFAAIMVCSDADEACPFVPGAAARISLPFEDPKRYDGTPQAGEAYAERLRDVTREVLFALERARGD